MQSFARDVIVSTARLGMVSRLFPSPKNMAFYAGSAAQDGLRGQKHYHVVGTNSPVPSYLVQDMQKNNTSCQTASRSTAASASQRLSHLNSFSPFPPLASCSLACRSCVSFPLPWFSRSPHL
eukprot:3142209-Rhodomonas_salina.1